MARRVAWVSLAAGWRGDEEDSKGFEKDGDRGSGRELETGRSGGDLVRRERKLLANIVV